MKRPLLAIAALLFFAGGILALFWFGRSFISYISSTNGFSLERPEFQSVPLGTPAVIDLHGNGFSRETSVSLFVDVNNSEAIVGSYPLEGTYNESLLSGHFIYLASDEGGLQVLDIAEPQQPQLLKRYLAGRTIIDIHRNGNYLYLSCGSLGVSIMRVLPDGLLDHIADISTDSLAKSCQFLGGFLYVAAGSGGLLVYDVHQLEQAKLVQIIKLGSAVSKVSLAGGFLYVTAGRKQINIYQLDRPQTPRLIESLKFVENLYDSVIQQQRLYVATEGGVSLYGLTDPAHPELLRRWADFGSANKIFAGLENIYVSDNFSGLRIINSENESSPGYFNLTINPRTVVEIPDYLFVAGSNRGLLIVDRKLLLMRQAVKTIQTQGSARDLFIKNNWMYVANSRDGVSLHDLDAEGASFTTLSTQWGASLAAYNDLLFVAQAKEGIKVFDISTLGQPEVIAIWPNLQAMSLAAAADEYLLLSKGIHGVELVDISDLHHPVVRDVLSDIHALDVALDGHFVYIASKNEGLMIYELEKNAKLNCLGHLQTPFPMNQFDIALSVYPQGGMVYVANGRSGMLIVDVTNPAEPTILSSIPISGICKEVRVVDDKAYITSHHGGITVVDVKDPENPTVLSIIPMSAMSKGLQVVGDLIYVAQRKMGVTVVPVPIAAETTKFISEKHLQVTLPSPHFPGRYSLQVNNKRESVVVDGVVDYQ
ncbi:MAG: hypothetical protein U9Q61_11110 [Thermodesulfobacteriota bacterium]|nr:hypothetical protein [Thermodesulfobacteriota bacterium]